MDGYLSSAPSRSLSLFVFHFMKREMMLGHVHPFLTLNWVYCQFNSTYGHVAPTKGRQNGQEARERAKKTLSSDQIINSKRGERELAERANISPWSQLRCTLNKPRKRSYTSYICHSNGLSSQPLNWWRKTGEKVKGTSCRVERVWHAEIRDPRPPLSLSLSLTQTHECLSWVERKMTWLTQPQKNH